MIGKGQVHEDEDTEESPLIAPSPVIVAESEFPWAVVAKGKYEKAKSAQVEEQVPPLAPESVDNQPWQTVKPKQRNKGLGTDR